ncbi:MAG: baseplate J/gp47 family protein, partial [Rhizobiales bacterium]|nr:baseplate J/gp47 family protein [Hyphomicrobiales bacterium]
MKSLPKPVFFDTDALKHEQQLIEIFEGLADRKLYPAQLETLLIKLITYVGSVLRADAHHSLLQNLVQFAEGEMIDQHAINRSINHEIKRLDASFAKTTLRFSTDAVVAQDILIPIFTHVSSADGQFTFITDGEVKLIAGQLSIDIAATANIKGKAANDLSVGTLTELEEPIAYIDAVQNITITSGGADIEDDDHFKERVRTADNLLSKGGPIGGYTGLVFGAHADIKAVTIKSPLPNDIHVYPLLSTGIASPEI